MSGSRRAAGLGALTPAVAGAAAFAALAALVSILFVTARGGLEVPLAATTAPPVAAASSAVSPGATATPSLPATPAPPSPEASPPAGSSPTPGASLPPSPAPSGPTARPDPLSALAPCPDHPGCYLYTVRRGDSYSGVSDRYGVLLWIMDALNPEVADKRVIVVGQTLYLGRDPTARLEPCPDGTCHLYTVRSGDTLSAIASRYALPVSGIEALNPTLDPAFIVTGQVIRLPLYQPA